MPSRIFHLKNTLMVVCYILKHRCADFRGQVVSSFSLFLCRDIFTNYSCPLSRGFISTLKVYFLLLSYHNPHPNPTKILC